MKKVLTILLILTLSVGAVFANGSGETDEKMTIGFSVYDM